MLRWDELCGSASSRSRVVAAVIAAISTIHIAVCCCSCAFVVVRIATRRATHQLFARRERLVTHRKASYNFRDSERFKTEINGGVHRILQAQQSGIVWMQPTAGSLQEILAPMQERDAVSGVRECVSVQVQES